MNRRSESASTIPLTLDEIESVERIGPFRLIRKLGSGGMGVVYLAQQESPTRLVAVKVIRDDRDRAELGARLRAEIQALALMDHPAVARVYTGGATDAGHPYLVMEYVPGQPITGFCDDRVFSIRRRLKLFLEVCEGVKHAHLKRVVHLDLKPSNILVAEKDDTPKPVLIDFGLAGASIGVVEQEATGRVEMPAGTLEYMSPEQLEPTRGGLDPRADVYALGVILYELMTGQLPYATAHDFTSQLRLIRESIPEPPSRVAFHGTEGVARRRACPTPSALSRQLCGDIDGFVMKAMARDRADRYATVVELSEDVLRYFNHEPLRCRAVTTRYRIAKFFRRHRRGSAVFGSMLLLLFALTMALGVQLQRSKDLNQEKQREIVQRVHTQRELEETRTELRALLSKRIAGSKSASLIDLKGKVDLGWNEFEMGGVSDGERTIREALDQLTSEHEGSVETLVTTIKHGVVRSEMSARAIAVAPSVPGALSMVPDGEPFSGRAGLADASYAAFEKLEELLGERDPIVIRSRINLARIYQNNGNRSKALEHFQRVASLVEGVLGPDHPDVLLVYTSLISLLEEEGRAAEARHWHEVRSRVVAGGDLRALP